MGMSQCNNYADKAETSLLGRYELAGYDNSGQLVFTGTISLVSLDQNHLKGQCKIARRQDAPAGLLDQEANCEALMDGKNLSMDFAPSLDDAGLLLEGQFDGGRGQRLLDVGWVCDERALRQIRGSEKIRLKSITPRARKHRKLD